MRRREFIVGLGSAAAWPVAVRAQSGRVRGIAALMIFQESDPFNQKWLKSFQRGLEERGWIEGRNIRLARRWANGRADRLPALIEEIAGLQPEIILAQSTPVAAALHNRRLGIPVVFVQVSDPVGDGFVDSLANPGGMLTGFSNTMASLGGKWLELLREATPNLSRVGFLYNRAVSAGGGSFYMESFKSAAASLNLAPVPLELQRVTDIEPAIAQFAASGGDGIVANSDAFNTANRDSIIASVNRHRLPAIYYNDTFPPAGGLMSYGVEIEQQWKAAAGYVDRLLRGEPLRSLPVQQPTKFVLIVNLKTAKAIGLTVPESFLVRADEVIE
jgi:putative ABC transport system substrate-binding protein